MATQSIFDEPIRGLVSEHLIGVRRDTSIDSLLKLIIDQGLSRVAVLDDDGRPIGVVSKTDLLMRTAIGGVQTVMNVMTPGVIAVPAQTSLAEASAVMSKQGLHALVVTSGEKFGWLSATDVVRWVAAHAHG